METRNPDNEIRNNYQDLTEDLTEHSVIQDSSIEDAGIEPEEDSIQDIERQSCIICLGDDISSENMCFTDCSHMFCKDCLDEWLDQGKKTCPMCRETIRYFKNEDIQYRVVVQNERASSTATISRSVVENIIRQNYNMRYIIFLMFLSLVMGFNAYTVLANDYNYLNFRYIGATQNNTVLMEQLNECQNPSSGFNEILVYILQVQGPAISNVLKKCAIPLFSYYKCFPE